MFSIFVKRLKLTQGEFQVAKLGDLKAVNQFSSSN